jgi:hypothetical protein
MAGPLSFLDSFLHGRETLAEELLDPNRVRTHLKRIALMVLILGSIYGLGMGSYAGLGRGSWMFALASAVKVPLLLFGITMLCFPALYVFGVAGGSDLRGRSVLGAILAAQGVLVLALVALLPVVLFFMTSTRNYAFTKFVQLVVWGIAGLLALKFLFRLLKQMDPALVKNRRLMVAWMVLFTLVGSQAAWWLRPYMGNRAEDFEWRRANTSGNVYASVFQDVARAWKNRGTTRSERREMRLAREPRQMKRLEKAIEMGIDPTTLKKKDRDQR